MLLKRLSSFFVFLLVLFAMSSALAQDWSTTFEADAVNSYVSDDGLKFVVVAAGDRQEASRAAAASLADALRQGSAAVVMDDGPLGSVAGLDDDEILEKAKKLPVDQVAVVRVFASGEDRPDTVVVTVRDTSGEVVWAVSSAKGTAVDPNTESGQAAGGMGVSKEASEAVGEVAKTEAKSQEEARETYARDFVWFHNVVGINQAGGVVGQWSYAFKGKYQKRLEPEEFYNEVGRADLAEEYSSNRSQAAVAGTIAGIGYLGLIGGGTWALVNWLSESDTTTPLIVTGASTAMIIGGVLMAPSEIHPVSPPEARELADMHNKKLREELGLSEDFTPVPEVSQQGIDYNFGIGLTPEGASGVLQISF